MFRNLEHGKQYSYSNRYTEQRKSTCLLYVQWFENKKSKVQQLYSSLQL